MNTLPQAWRNNALAEERVKRAFVGPPGVPGDKGERGATGRFNSKVRSLKLYNPDTGKYHAITLSGAEGAVTIDFGAGET